MFKDPQMLYLMVNVLLMMVIGTIGYLLRRAITSSDQKVDEVVREVKQSTKAMGELQLLIVGDYLPRKEYKESQMHINSTLEQVRENIHNLRGYIQTNSTKLAMLEGMLKGLTDTKGSS